MIAGIYELIGEFLRFWIDEGDFRRPLKISELPLQMVIYKQAPVRVIVSEGDEQMGIHLTQNKIMDLCGSVSFKRGEMYSRAGKVVIEQCHDDYCKAVVEGKENFHVTINVENDGEIRTECSCPTLPFYRYKCQHVAAVLITMNEREVPTESSLTEGLLSIFDSKPRSSGHQLHFEDREVLDLTFTLSPVPTKKAFMLGINLQVEGVPVEDIRQFLEDVNEGRASSLNSTFTFDVNLHCFKREADAVLQRLIEINNGAYNYRGGTPRTLVIPPPAWEKLLPDLNEAQEVDLEIYGKPATRLRIRETGLPVKFHFGKRPEKGHFLKIDGLDHVLMLQPYNLVLSDMQLFRLSGEDCKRLADLKQMVETSGTHRLPISNEQIGFFIEKVVPGLRRIGEVQLDETVLDQLVKSPLNAKLYLDRVNNRLLASLEFQYDHMAINPLIERELPASSVLVRDLEKEEEILRIMEESSFAQTDEGYLLHNEELEYEFLYNVLPKLEKLVRVYATTAIRIRIFREAPNHVFA
ncbi:SNF2 helicase associated domain-containing protein [Sporosarcina thermotolerans]|uniref:SNF2 helicase associated domain-containing protein n=1 Tax=Sporosarcina thermotolerans TaxID=633404 RepID=UPI003218F51E